MEWKKLLSSMQMESHGEGMQEQLASDGNIWEAVEHGDFGGYEHGLWIHMPGLPLPSCVALGLECP